MLVLADILVHVNHLSRFLQTRSLVYSAVTRKVTQITDDINKLVNKEGHYFKTHSRAFLQISKERSDLARQNRRNQAVVGMDIEDTIAKFKEKKMIPFIAALQK